MTAWTCFAAKSRLEHHLLAGVQSDSRHIRAGNQRQIEAVGVHAASDPHVEVIQSHMGHLDHDFTWSWFRLRYLDHAEYFWPTMRIDSDRLHGSETMMVGMSVNPRPVPKRLGLRLLRRLLSSDRGEVRALQDALRLQRLMHFTGLLAATILLPSVLLAYFGISSIQGEELAKVQEVRRLAEGAGDAF